MNSDIRLICNKTKRLLKIQTEEKTSSLIYGFSDVEYIFET